MKEKWYAYSEGEVIKKLSSNSRNGLSESEVDERIKTYGFNKLKEEKKKSIISKFIAQFKDVMIIILIIAAILSAVVSVIENEPFTDTIIIFVVVFLNALLGVIQENKAEKAIDALKSMSAQTIKVKRESKVKSVPVEELVPGDIVLLEAGDYVPADMRIIENHSLRAEESALTGESVAVDKDDVVLSKEKEIPLAERVNMLYSGSSITYGRGVAIVVETGMNTELGKIAEAISSINTELTPLQKKMNEISKMLSIIVVMIAIVMVVMGIIQGRPILDVFMLAIALAVAAIPEGLATVITITLAIGVQKMAKQKSIIRKMSAVEALGSTEVICSDKTGTLTQNKMTVRKIFFDMTLLDVTDAVPTNDISMLTKIMTLCNDTNVSIENGERVLLGDPTETALVSFAEKLNILKDEFDRKYVRVDEVPFDSERKLMTTVNKDDKKYMVCTKGAIESILEKCKFIYIDGKIREITDKDIKEIKEYNIQMANQALRVLGYAFKTLDKENSAKGDKNTLESELIFVGMTGMIDPPRPEVKDAVKECFNAGMIPVMITGDNIDTASAIARELGILKDGDEAVTGLDVDNMSDDELKSRVNKIRVYARVSPDNKIRIVKAWKANGRTVAMTGDGVNDAPALKGADIGVGMGITGTEVSKSVSSMVLSDDNFATIVVAVKEGRRIYTNIQNVITYLLASNIAEVIIIFFATLFNKVLLMPIQILWINLISDTIPAVALGFEKAEEGIMKKKPRSANEKFFNNFMVLRIIIPAIIKSVAVFLIYYLGCKLYNEAIGATSVFITLSILEILFAFICRSDKHTVIKIGIFKNVPMLLCVIGTMILQILVILTPITRQWLGIEALDKTMYEYIGAVILSSLVLLEITKVTLAKIFKKA